MSIFVSIAAYQDPTLVKTIKSALDNADNPDDLVFAIGLQYSEKPDLSIFPQNQLRVLSWSLEDRPGLIRIRYILSKLFRNEDYFLMTDSHMRFTPHWDTKLIEYLESLPGKQNVIMPQEIQTHSGKTQVNDQRFQFVNLNLFRDSPFSKSYDLLPLPVDNRTETFEIFTKTVSWRSGAIFTHGYFIDDVGFDPYSHSTHEEAYMSFRTFVSGWDTYQLNEDIIFHEPEEYYNQDWEDMDKRLYTSSYTENELVEHEFSLAFIYNDYSKYAIKNAKRTPKEYWDANKQSDVYLQVKAAADIDLFNNIRI